jgi:hypothetical protein
MPDPKKPQRDAIAALLDLAAKDDQTAEEAEVELRAAGVDVDGFLTRLRTRLDRQAEENRLTWLHDARRRLETRPGRPVPDDLLRMDHAALVARVQKRQGEDGQHAYFHKLEELKDDDLRTLLMDLDDLGANDKEPA